MEDEEKIEPVMECAPVSVVIPTYNRPHTLLASLRRLEACVPPPKEVLVHVDYGDLETATLLRRECPDVTMITSDQRMGPGGGRNRLVAQASQELIVSLDDDSWPLVLNFFALVEAIFLDDEELGLVACEVHEADAGLPLAAKEMLRYRPFSELKLSPTTNFEGCGTAFRRRAFEMTEGYLPLRQAYGMEEADVSLQLLDCGWKLQRAKGLAVFHDCDREQHHAEPAINAAQIRNTALLAFLRYPPRYWVWGCLKTINRVRFALQKRRFRGILTGLGSIPLACFRYRRYRNPVSEEVMQVALHR